MPLRHVYAPPMLMPLRFSAADITFRQHMFSLRFDAD